MALSARTNLRGKVVTRFPARVLAGSGITITKANGVYTFSLTGPTSGSFDVAFGSTPGTYLRRDTTVWAASAILGDDLPNPSTTTKGGVKALPSASNQVLSGISTSGTPTAASVTGTGDVVLANSPIIQTPNASGGLYLNSVLWADSAAGPIAVISLPHQHTLSSLTGSSSTSALAISQTWNTSGVVHAIDLSITNTASGAGSNLIRLRAGASGATEIFAVRSAATATLRLGNATFLQAGSFSNIFSNSSGVGYVNAAGSAQIFSVNDTGVISVYGSSSGTTTITAAAAASGAWTLPSATDTFVGKATTDDLTNKTLTSATLATKLNKGSFTIAQSGSAVSHTGTVVETTIATIAIPANVLGSNGKIRIEALFSYSGGAGTWQPRFKFGGTTFHEQTAFNTATLSARMDSQFTNANATNAQVAASLTQANFAGNTNAYTTMAIDTTSSQNLTITMQLGNTGDTVVLRSYTVQLILG